MLDGLLLVTSGLVASPISTAVQHRGRLETFQDFLIELDMKPRMHLVKISIFSLNIVTVRPTKKKLGTFLENKIF